MNPTFLFLVKNIKMTAESNSYGSKMITDKVHGSRFKSFICPTCCHIRKLSLVEGSLFSNCVYVLCVCIALGMKDFV